MDSKLTGSNSDYGQLIIIAVLTLIVSILPEIIFREWIGSVPAFLSFVKLIVLFLAYILFRYLKNSNISKYTIVLGVIILVEILTKLTTSSSIWQETFDMNSFVGNFGGSILLKLIGIIPVLAVLIALFKSPAEVYISKGDLSIKADEIKWLGIRKHMISWRKLAIISALCISTGTVLLTIFTVTGTSARINTDNLIKYIPFVVIFALLNSLCEGIVYRSAILGSLKNVLPKNQLMIIAAMIFGIAHYYGAPSGIVGVIMSFLLGWYLCRSMYETKGFVSSWIIHFMQDIVIFATILLLGNYY
jgi:membrane protease YdiL (CAAX protease family)